MLSQIGNQEIVIGFAATDADYFLRRSIIEIINETEIFGIAPVEKPASTVSMIEL